MSKTHADVYVEIGVNPTKEEECWGWGILGVGKACPNSGLDKTGILHMERVISVL